MLASLPTGAGADNKITTNLSVEPQIFVVGRHLENRRPDLRPFRHRGLVDGGGEKRHVVVDVLGEDRGRGRRDLAAIDSKSISRQ